MQAGIFEYGNGVLSFNAGGAITATSEYLPNPYLITYNNIPVRSGVTVTSMTKTDWQGTYTLSSSARTNMAKQSQSLNTTWSANQVSVIADAIVAPDGTVTADKIAETAVTNFHYLNGTVAFVNGTTYTAFVYAKAAERSFIDFGFNGLANGDAIFDLTNGVVTTQFSGLISSQITAMGNGWYRCTITGTAGAGTNGLNIGVLINSSTSNYLGVTGYGAYVWGVQAESGTSATSYIPTTSAAVTATDYSVTAGGIVTLGTNYWPGQYTWTGTGTQLPYCTTGPTNRYNRMAVGISGLAAETVSIYPSYDGQVWESTALRPIDLSTGAVSGATTLTNGTYRIHDTPWKQVLFMASAATSGAVRYSLLNAN